MTTQEKAESLVKSFNKILSTYSMSIKHRWEYAKQCAIICCEEILSFKMIYAMGREETSEGEFYEQVKTEIEKM